MQRPAQPISSWLVSSCLHVTALLLLLLAAAVVGPPPPLSPHVIPVQLHVPLTAPPLRQLDSGGGQGTPEPASKGQLPSKPTRRLFLPPQVAVNDQPRLVMAVGMIDAPLLEDALGIIGDPRGLLDGLGGGPGRGGIGNGPGDGIGDGPGSGISGLAATKEKLTRTPQIIFQVEPQYSEEARRAHVQGSVRLRIDVGLDGRPTNIRVVQPMGMGLDESAIEAVKRWRFRPALIGDRPVVAPALVEVGFHLL
ncbi:MAG: energy transducer TonB [Bryobacteraceae bacterium]